MNFAVLQFPASNCDQDAIHALRDVFGHSARYVWHKETSLGDADAVIVPGGFSYGDYLRCGAIARFSPVMQAVKQFAANGGLVLGICNGFQVLTRSRPAARRAGPQPRPAIPLRTRFPENRHPRLAVHEPNSRGQTRCVFPLPTAKAAISPTMRRWQSSRPNNQILWQYCSATGDLTEAANPNGSLLNIAGICNAAPERGRPDAASRTRQRTDARQRRRPGDFRKHDCRVAKENGGEGGVRNFSP